MWRREGEGFRKENRYDKVGTVTGDDVHEMIMRWPIVEAGIPRSIPLAPVYIISIGSGSARVGKS